MESLLVVRSGGCEHHSYCMAAVICCKTSSNKCEDLGMSGKAHRDRLRQQVSAGGDVAHAQEVGLVALPVLRPRHQPLVWRHLARARAPYP